MRSVLVAGMTLAIAAGASAQERSALYSNPVPPSREALDRLNLRPGVDEFRRNGWPA